ncbi:NVEALA domain-containing protein [Bacteroides sp. OttesenSCG-928-F21]|nr:NVEALA domain-containing protein [Bacteroides sp. OttesenSCG-928-F21]
MGSAIGYNVYTSQKEIGLSDLALNNIEALASNESGNRHTLECGASGVKMCEATCGIHQVTLKAWGNGKTATMTCN